VDVKRNQTWIAFGLVLLAAVVAYHNSFGGIFVLDDLQGIVLNPTLRDLWPLSGPLKPISSGGLTVSGRPILNLSFAINYAISGTDIWSYHALNLLIHFAAGLTLFGIVRRTLERIGHPAAAPLATIAATLWIAHPLQTEAVTYVIQRAESLMGLLYLLTLYAAIRSVDSRRPRLWYGAAIVACALGMGTKEVTVTAPLLVLLYDRTFLAGSFTEAWRQRKGLYVALALTWVPLIWLVAITGNRGDSAGFGVAPWWSHAAMQFAAIARYLWLSLWPHPLIIDYGFIEPRGVWDVLPYALVVLPLLAVPLLGLIHNKPWAFLGAWFFLILAPTSSIVPSARQTFSEHRMYLPLAAVIVAAVLALFWLLQQRIRTTVLVGALWAAILCLITVHRNADYRSELALYANVVTTFPNNAYGRLEFGTALLAAGQAEEALSHLEAAAKLKSDDKAIQINRAYALLLLKRAPEAVAGYEAGLRLGPVGPETFLGYAAALVSSGRTQEGMDYFSEYTQQRPQDASAQFTVGQLLLIAGNRQAAIAYLQRAQALAPDNDAIRELLQQAQATPQ
jgi:protein O-mannosyl-transferase